MHIPNSWLIPVAGLSGVAFSLIGISYRMGQPRGIAPGHVMACIAAAGIVIFGVQSAGLPLADVPLLVIALGVAAGLTQYVLVRIMKAALRMGPLSPAWCALALSFLPTIAFSSISLGEKLGLMHGLALIAGIACVLAASACQNPLCQNTPPPCPLPKDGEGEVAAPLPKDGEGEVAGPLPKCGEGEVAGPLPILGEGYRGGGSASRLAYVGVLLLIPTFNCVTQISIKVLGRPDAAGGSMADRFSGVFLLLMYFVIGTSLAIELLVTRNYRVPLLHTAGLGIMAAAGSTAGMTGLTACAALPAAILFPLTSVVSILVAAIVSTAAFGERRALAWYGTVGFGALTVVLANL